MFSYQLHNSFTGAAFYRHELISADMFVHGFFTRKGGSSIGDFEGLNCSAISGDLIEDVHCNREIIKKSITHKSFQLITLSQIHGNKVVIIDNESNGNIKQPTSGFEADGLVTNNKNILLGILTADCAPILMADNNARVIGACHAGWKGALSGIIENTVLQMCNIGAKTKDIRCVIGPTISQESYEVDADFRENILDKSPLALECFYPDTRIGIGDFKKKFFFNLQEYCRFVLRRACVHQFDCINIDTYKNPKLFYSYRLSCHEGKSKYGRQISIIGIR